VFKIAKQITDLFPNAKWNAGNRSIDLPGGVNLQEGTGFKINPNTNKAEVDSASSLVSPYMTAPMPQMDTNRFMQGYNSGLDLYGGLHGAQSNQLQVGFEDKRNQLGMDYTDTMDATKKNENKSLANVSTNAAAAGIRGSGIASGQRDSMSDRYEDKYAMIGKDRDKQMKSLGMAEMAGQEALDAQLQQQAFLYAQGLESDNLSAQRQQRKDVISYLTGIDANESAAKQQAWDNQYKEDQLRLPYETMTAAQKATSDYQNRSLEETIANNKRVSEQKQNSSSGKNDLASLWSSADPNTQDFVTEIFKFDNFEQAEDLFHSNQKRALGANVNMGLVLEMMKAKWPREYAAKASAANQPMDLSQINAMAGE